MFTFSCLQWVLYNEDKQYPVVCNGDKYRAMIEREGGPEALKQWKNLEDAMKPLQAGAASFPAAAIRNDIGDNNPHHLCSSAQSSSKLGIP